MRAFYYIALLSLQPRRQNNLNGLVKQLAYRHTHYRPHPQPLSKGRGEEYALFLFVYFVVAWHFTPLSPWRGVGGEAGSWGLSALC